LKELGSERYGKSESLTSSEQSGLNTQTKIILKTNKMNHFTTLSEAMTDLRQRGYTEDFAPDGDFLKVTSTEIVKYRSHEIIVDEFHRFEGPSDPGDEMTLYAISCAGGMKGLFVSAQGTYSDEVSPELMAKFNVADRAETNTDGAVQPIEAGTSFRAE
jgi:hypothetical protein